MREWHDASQTCPNQVCPNEDKFAQFAVRDFGRDHRRSQRCTKSQPAPSGPQTFVSPDAAGQAIYAASLIAAKRLRELRQPHLANSDWHRRRDIIRRSFSGSKSDRRSSRSFSWSCRTHAAWNRSPLSSLYRGCEGSSRTLTLPRTCERFGRGAVREQRNV